MDPALLGSLLMAVATILAALIALVGVVIATTGRLIEIWMKYHFDGEARE